MNGKKILSGDDWTKPVSADFGNVLKLGGNEISLLVTNGGETPNPAGAALHIAMKTDGAWAEIVSDSGWEAANGKPEKNDWKPAIEIPSDPWEKVSDRFPGMLASELTPRKMIRASLLKSDLLMRTLGRPNREQIVTTRPEDLTTLEAMDLNNGAILDERLGEGAKALRKMNFASPRELTGYLWRSALCRDPTTREMEIVLAQLGEKPTDIAVQDLLWSILMMPEFQIIR